MKWISLKAIVLAVFLGSVVPSFVLWGGFWVAYWTKSEALGSAIGLLGIIWLALFTPLVVGYLAAKHAFALPYYHALGTVCFVVAYIGFGYIRARGHADHPENPWWLLAIYVATSIPLSLVGARLAVRKREL